MESRADYFSMSISKRNSVDEINWEDWHKSLALWDLQYALESPAMQETPTPGGIHSNVPNFMLPRESPASMFSSSTYSEESLAAMQNYLGNGSPIIANEDVLSTGGMEVYHTSYSQLLERDSCSRPRLPHHLSSPAMLNGYPLPPSHQQSNSHGLGISHQTDEQDDAYSGHSSNSPTPRPSQGRNWEEVQKTTANSNSTHLAAPSTSPRSKRSSISMSHDENPISDPRAKRISLKARHNHSRSMTDGAATGSDVVSNKTAKLAHNIVERNYRDRLNDQIAELSSYLFDSSTESKARSRPPKSLVISRAKERLMELASHNDELLTQVAKMKQQIAVLDHIVTAAGGAERGHALLS